MRALEELILEASKKAKDSCNSLFASTWGDGPATQRTKHWPAALGGTLSAQGLKQVCRKGYGEIPDLEAWGCSHFQRGAPWAAWHKKVAVIPTMSCKVIVGLLRALQMDGPGSSCFYVNLVATGS